MDSMILKEKILKVGLRPAKMVKVGGEAFSLQAASLWLKKALNEEHLPSSVMVMLDLMCDKLEGVKQVVKPDIKSALVKASNEKLKERQVDVKPKVVKDRSNPPFYTAGLYKINNWHARRTPEGFVVRIKDVLYLVQGLSCFIDGIEYTWEDKNISEVRKA